MFRIVLVEPEIPHNTGAIGRLCVATGAELHLIKPFGFSLDDRSVKRAGLDYWEEVKLYTWNSLEELQKENGEAHFWFLTTKAKHSHWEAPFKKGDFLVFGPETRGLPESLLKENIETALKIPMTSQGGIRSLNLATSVAIVLYEGLRTQGFSDS